MADALASFEAFEWALVRSCYRVLLRREPEPAALASYDGPQLPGDQEDRIRARLELFVSCNEFTEKMRASADAGLFDGSLFEIRNLLSKPRAAVVDEFRRRCRTTYLGGQVALCRVLGRFHMFVQTTDVGFAVHVMHTGGWEMPLTEFMTRTVKPGMRVVDVGANFGYYSLLMSELAGHEGRCTAFEPNLDVARLLKRTLSVNGFESRSRVREVALTDRERGPMQFFIPHAEPKNARLEARVPDWLAPEGKCVDVPTSSLDQLAPELGTVDFVKIDAEGAEMQILQGMQTLLHEQRPDLVIEVNCSRGYDIAPVMAELIGLYGQMRYVADDGHAHRVDIDTVRTTNVGEDWLLYFTKRS